MSKVTLQTLAYFNHPANVCMLYWIAPVNDVYLAYLHTPSV